MTSLRSSTAVASISVEFLRTRGPGGQHRNKAETGVRLRHLPTGIVVTATERRSRSENLAVARERLRKRLEKLAAKPKPRKKSAPTRAARERRLQEKRRRSALKGDRRRGED